MTIHVGINPYWGDLSYYDDTKKRQTNLKIVQVTNNDKEKVDSMFNEIKSKINGELGCLCICLDYFYGNEIRKKFIESGLKFGFKNVEITNLWQAFYLNEMSQINYKPLNGNIIWIKCGNYFHVWQISDNKAKYIGLQSADLANVIEKLKPDIVLSCSSDEETDIKNISKACKFFIHEFFGDIKAKGSLVKARITAGDKEVAHLHVDYFLSDEVRLNYAGEEIILFPRFQLLPIIHSHKLSKKPNCNFLQIDFGTQESKTFIPPDYKEANLTLKVDTNEIYSVTFDECSNVESPMSNKNAAATSATSTIFNSFKQLFPRPSSSVHTNLYSIPKMTTTLNPKINAIGIDLGTSRCCAAGLRKNGIQTVPLDNTGERLLPSFVAFDEQKVKCGKIVVSRLRYFSKSTIFDSKRIIGRDFGDIEIDENWQFSLDSENSKVYLQILGFNGERKRITAEEVAAELLKFIKQKAEEFQGTKLSKVVVTVPAAFNDDQKSATLKAAKMAGFDEIILLPEPIAAAFAYFIDQPIPNNSTLLIFDLGGGTLDVCIFKIQNDQIQIISNTGDSKLGGRNFDTILMNFFKNAFYTKNGISISKDKKYKLMLECQRVKEDLSSVLNSSIDIDEFDPTKSGVISINREEFQRIAQVLLNRIKNTVQSALLDSKLQPDQINKVLQVGGGSRMPMIKNLLKEIFPSAEHCCEEHPDEVVAIGAAYYAYSMFK